MSNEVRGSSLSRYKTAENSRQPASLRPIRLHCLGVFDQPNCGCQLWVLKGRGQSRHRLRPCDPRRNFEDFLSQMIDPLQQTAAASNENSFAHVIDKRFLIKRAFEQLECLTDTE